MVHRHAIGWLSRGLLTLLIATCVFAIGPIGDAAARAESAHRRASEVPTPDQIAEARAALDADTGVDTALREQITALLEGTQRSLETERIAAQRLLELQQELAALPARREAIEADMALMVDAPVVVPTDATLDRLRTERDEADANLRTAGERQASLDRELAQLAERRSALPDEIAALEDTLDEVDQALATGLPPDLPPALAIARGWSLAAQRAELVRRIAVARAEMALIDARPANDAARRERAARRIAVREGAVRQWQAIVLEATARQAEIDARKARAIAADASPAVRAVAERTAELVEQLVDPDPEKGLAAKNRLAEEYIARIDLGLARLARQYEQDRRRVLDTGMAGLSNQRLRRQRLELPDLRTLSRGRVQLRQDLARTQRDLTDLEIERESMPSLLAQREEILASFPTEPDELLHAEMVTELDRRLVERQRALDALIDAHRQRDEMLLQMQEKLIPLTALTRQYMEFIDERVLWIKSMDAINTRDISAAWNSLWSNIRPTSTGSFAAAASRRLWDAPLLPALLLAATAALAWLSTKVRQRRQTIAELVARPHTDRIRHTLEVTLITIGWAAVWPTIIAIVAWMIGGIDDASALGPMVARGLVYVAWVLLLLRLVGEITRRNGLAVAHYGWRPEACTLIRRHLTWFGPLVLVLVFIQGSLEWEQSRTGIDPLARLATMTLSAAAALLGLRLLGPRRGLLVGVFARRRAPWIDRLVYVLYPILVALPLLLVALDVLGFSFTVNQFHATIFKTILFAVGVLLVSGLITRWLLVTRRRLAMEDARKRRAAATAGEDGQATTADGDALAIDSAGMDLVAIDAQTRQLMHTGLAVTVAIGLLLIWSRLLPALGMLDRVELWPSFGQVREALIAPPALEAVIGEQGVANIRRIGPVTTGPHVPVFTAAGTPLSGGVPATALPSSDAASGPRSVPAGTTASSDPLALIPGMATAPSGPSSARSQQETETGRITLANLLGALLFTVLAILVSRNIPGLLEIVLLQRLPLEPSGRYAVTALTRYVIAVGAIFLAFGTLGIGWSQVQWLVAAATVGVAFGLQEIVANFISGVIILFEQPIRVGDTVTIGNVSGTVTKIRMRATTITDWDRKELIIPNKEFITGQVINWTLSDPTLRIVVPVGIAYGSDTATAERLLLECARNHPIVLRDPPPAVVFTRFGESALDFELRAFLPSIEFLIRVRHDLHNAIDRAFREAHIEIAFPQRDIHVRDIAGRLQLARPARGEDGAKPLADPLPPDQNPVSN